MRIITLIDEKGTAWRDFAIIVEEPENPQFSETYYLRAARRKLFKKFADYWWSSRFPNYSDQFIDEVGKTLEANGWTVKAYEVEQ